MATPTTTRLTYEQWAARPETTRIEELIDGELVVSASARAIHQVVVSRLITTFAAVTEARGDLVMPSPFGIRAGEATVVEPDLVVFLADRVDFDLSEHTVTTPPDLVVEVLSPSNRRHDLVRKRPIFEQHGIREVWYVDIEARRVEQLVLTDGRYGQPHVHLDGDTVTAAVVPDVTLAVTDLFRAPGERA